MSIVFVDIDGVLNPFTHPDLEGQGYFPVDAVWSTWWLHMDHGEWLNLMAEKARLVWATSWEHDALRINTLFDLPDMDVIDFSLKAGQSAGTWKLADIQKYIGKSREKVVILEDELEEDAFSWAKERGNTLLIQCDPSVGLTLTQVSDVLNFLSDD
jgi:HAD domain in Swiss Army Knife RNA repair proteins